MAKKAEQEKEQEVQQQDPAGTVTDEAGKVTDEAGTVTDEAGTVTDEAGRVTDEAEPVTGTDKEAGADREAAGKTKKSGKTAVDKKKAAVAKLEAELKELKDKYLRLSAEFDNYRKRTLKEKVDLTKYAGESIFMNLLPVLDDLDRALAHINDAGDMKAIKEGVELIAGKFREYLASQGIKEITALHEELDTDLHAAISKVPVDDKKMKGKVVDVVEKGYMLNNKVIRYAKVVIGE
jgi:molecular chaperone GrpE